MQGTDEITLLQFQEMLQGEEKDYDTQILKNALAIANPEHFNTLLRKDFPIMWFICTMFDARDPEQVIFIVADKDRVMGLTS